MLPISSWESCADRCHSSCPLTSICWSYISFSTYPFLVVFWSCFAMNSASLHPLYSSNSPDLICQYSPEGKVLLPGSLCCPATITSTAVEPGYTEFMQEGFHSVRRQMTACLEAGAALTLPILNVSTQICTSKQSTAEGEHVARSYFCSYDITFKFYKY